MESIKTKSGIQPVILNELPFEITTAMAEEYLQKKMDLLKNKLGDVKVRLFTTEASKKFLPFIVLLPESVTYGNTKKQGNGKELSIFTNSGDDKEGNRVKMRDEVFNLFGAYLFNKEDESSFFSPEWRRIVGVSSSTSAKLKFARTPHIQPYANGKVKFVSFLIDPIRLFSEMVNEEGKSARYKIEITDIEKIASGSFKYTFLKSFKSQKGNNNYDEVLAKEINAKMR